MSDYELLLATVRQDFMAMNEICFRQLNPGTAFDDNWHLHAIAQALDEARVGDNRRRVILTPPRSTKSLTGSVAWPARLLGLDPSARIMVFSYSEKLAVDLSNDTRRFMESDIYRDLYPDTILTRSTSTLLETSENGKRIATWIGGPTTGFGANWIIIDDPHNAADIYSPAARQRVNDYVKLALLSRFNDELTGRIILLMQRLHDDDLAGQFLRSNWPCLKFQAEATEDASFDIGERDFHIFKKGELLNPRRLPVEVLEQKRLDMGSVAYQAQYLQEPVPETGNMIESKWLRYDDPPLNRAEATVVLSLDTATKTDPANDYSACTVWLCTTSKHYLLDTWRARVNFPDLRQKMLDLIAVHKANTILIEDQGTGSALIQELTNLGLPAVPRRSNVPKAARLAGISSYIEARLMVLPTGDPHWLAEFVSELLSFPAGRYDDQVDTVSQYFEWVRTRPKPDFFHADFGWGEDVTPDLDALAERIMWQNRSFGPGARLAAP